MKTQAKIRHLDTDQARKNEGLILVQTIYKGTQ